KKELADTLAQLKAAQDRKNELATENEKFKAQIAEIQKQLDELKGSAAQYAERTYFLRSQYAAWELFLMDYPPLRERWRIFLDAGPVSADNALPDFSDPILAPPRELPTSLPATQPATAPATSPAPASQPTSTSQPIATGAAR
ncbi:MAG: hypothetical protein ACREJC_12820, partial [Tepidisphaeraceae bacterium]